MCLVVLKPVRTTVTSMDNVKMELVSVILDSLGKTAAPEPAPKTAWIKGSVKKASVSVIQDFLAQTVVQGPALGTV